MTIRFPRVIIFCSVIAAAFVVGRLFAYQAAAPELTWWTTHALDKVRPGDAPPSAAQHAAKLFAGRNEFEPFQIVVRAETRPLTDVDVQVTDLQGPSGADIAGDDITIYFERYLNLRVASDQEGSAGEWPDPLIPKVDRYAGQRRNAFPFSVPAGRNQPLWIEIYVPPNSPPGTYSGAATITAAGLPAISVPITLTVWNFVLPSTSTLKTSFGFSGIAALKQHRGSYTNDDDLVDITYLYAKAALWHRISINGGTLSPPPLLNGAIDWSRYDREVGPFLNGTVFSRNQPLAGAKATTVDMRTTGSADTDEKKVSYWQMWVKHFADKGWLDRLFYYLWDEPAPKNYPQILALGKLSHSADLRIRNLVTTSFNTALQGVVDIWSPLINCMDSKPGFPPFCDLVAPREAYNEQIQQGKSLWWYQSCASHGCNGKGGDYFQGWPSYMIDASPVANRIFPWISWKYNIQGELYFSMNEAFSRKADPWTDVYLFGGNGDGTLFYPGRKAEIGGRTDIPIESIRLKLIREGLEDYEYLALLSKAGFSGCVNQIVSKMVTKTFQWERDPQALYAARMHLGELLDKEFNSSNGNGGGAQRSNSASQLGSAPSSCSSTD